MQKVGLSIAALAVCAATPVVGRPVFFNKPNVDRATFARDYAECEALAGGVQVQTNVPYSSNLYTLAAGSFFAGFFGAQQKRAMTDNVLRTCMADKDYRRVEPSDATQKQLRRMNGTQRVDQLFILAAAISPDGKVLPR